LNKHLLIGFWKTGSQSAAAKLLLSDWKLLIDESTADTIATLLVERFNHGAMTKIIDRMVGVTSREQFLAVISRAIKDRRVTRAQIEGLTLQARVLGLIE
jgi:hypothetical protein